jgi:hypothetical protein
MSSWKCIYLGVASYRSWDGHTPTHAAITSVSKVYFAPGRAGGVTPEFLLSCSGKGKLLRRVCLAFQHIQRNCDKHRNSATSEKLSRYLVNTVDVSAKTHVYRVTQAFKKERSCPRQLGTLDSAYGSQPVCYLSPSMYPIL